MKDKFQHGKEKIKPILVLDVYFPNKPKSTQITNCSSIGVIGSLGGFLGSLQATEIIKEILGNW